MTQAQQNATLETFAREKSGKGAARSLRREGKVPGILYSKNSKPVAIAITKNALQQEYMRGRFHSRIIELVLDGKTVKALPQDMQFHPVSDQIEHVDFLRVEDGMRLRVAIPVVFHGSDRAVGIKRGGVLNIVRREVEFLCDPAHIPAKIEVNIADLDIGESLHIGDVELPKGIEPTIKRNFTIATVAGRGKALEESAAEDAAEALADAAAADAKEAEAKKEDGKKEEGKK